MPDLLDVRYVLRSSFIVYIHTGTRSSGVPASIQDDNLFDEPCLAVLKWHSETTSH